MRDDFSKQTITEIAKGVGYRCSNPECFRPTVAANAAQDGTITIGVAAHICAASPGGPRYDAAQLPEVRRGKENGLWLCQICGRLIDVDPKKYTVEVLTKWKHYAQARAFKELVGPSKGGQSEEATRISSLVAVDASAGTDAETEKLFAKVRAAAEADLLTFQTGPIWTGRPVELTLRLAGKKGVPPFSISNLPPALEIAAEATIVAPPGTGKTTTVLQLADDVLAAGNAIPLYFRLGDWSAGTSTLLASIHARAAFSDITAGEITQLAARGRVLFLLDGWNELDNDARKNCVWSLAKCAGTARTSAS